MWKDDSLEASHRHSGVYSTKQQHVAEHHFYAGLGSSASSGRAEGEGGTVEAIVGSALFGSAATLQPLSLLIYGPPLTSEVVTW